MTYILVTTRHGDKQLLNETQVVYIKPTICDSSNYIYTEFRLSTNVSVYAEEILGEYDTLVKGLEYLKQKWFTPFITAKNEICMIGEQLYEIKNISFVCTKQEEERYIYQVASIGTGLGQKFILADFKLAFHEQLSVEEIKQQLIEQLISYGGQLNTPDQEKEVIRRVIVKIG